MAVYNFSSSVALEDMDLNDHMKFECVTREHSLPIWVWRNDPMTRRMSTNVDVIGWDTHRAWFEKTLADKNILFLFARSNNVGCGVVRFDFLSADRAEISINLNPKLRDRGIGTNVLRRSCAMMSRNFTGEFVAEIRRENSGSCWVFEKSRFSKFGESEDYVYYRLGQEISPALVRAKHGIKGAHQ